MITHIVDLRSRLSWGDPELQHAEMVFERMEWSLNSRFPHKNCGKYARPSVNQRMSKLRRSMLRHELPPDEILDDGWQDYNHSWATGYTETTDIETEYDASNEDGVGGIETDDSDPTWDFSTGEAELETRCSTTTRTIADWGTETNGASNELDPDCSTTGIDTKQDHNAVASVPLKLSAESMSGKMEMDLLERLQGYQFQYLVTVGSC